jgi:hypothetical protein
VPSGNVTATKIPKAMTLARVTSGPMSGTGSTQTSSTNTITAPTRFEPSIATVARRRTPRAIAVPRSLT